MNRKKIYKKRDDNANVAVKKVLDFLSLQDVILPEWRKITLNILSDEEVILINNTSYK